jgi:hypothetical protein
MSVTGYPSARHAGVTIADGWLSPGRRRLVPDSADRMRRLAGARLDVAEARCEALFASALQRSDAPTPDVVAETITRTVLQFGTRGCAGRMAQEFGDHPEAAAERMRWVRQLVTQPPGRG